MCEYEDLYFRSREEVARAYDSALILEKLYYLSEGIEIAHVIFHVLEKEVRFSEIWVHPDYRMKGYGRRLINAIQTVARAVKKDVTLTTHYGVLDFWIKCGFKVADKNPSYINMLWSPKSLLGTKA